MIPSTPLTPSEQTPTRVKPEEVAADQATHALRHVPDALAYKPKVSREFPSIPGFTIEAELGRGGMGVVFKAQQTKLNRTVALKMILPTAKASDEHVKRFLREAELVARLNHPNIVQIHESGEYQGQPYFALEFCNGGTLERLIQNNPQDPKIAAHLIEQLADALVAVHNLQILHRDIKPENILFEPQAPSGLSGSNSVTNLEASEKQLQFMIPKITDFGVARHGTRELTETGMAVGTPAYMAPEQAWADNKRIGPAVDIWALGVILYRLITGRAPFLGTTVLATLDLITREDPIPMRLLMATCPRDLETITLKCLQKDPTKRYPSAAALRDDLRAWREGRPITARPVGRIERSWKWLKRNPAWASVIACAGLGLGGIVWQWREAVHNRLLAEKNAIEARQAENEALDYAKAMALANRLAEKKAQEAKREAERAEKHLSETRLREKQARETVKDFFLTISDNLTLRNEDFRPLRLALLKKAQEYYERFLKDHAHSEELRAEAADSYCRLGELTSEMGDQKKAEEFYSRGRELWERLAQDHPENRDYLKSLGKCLNNLALQYKQLRRAKETIATLNEANQVFERLVIAEPKNVNFRRDLAISHLNRGYVFMEFGRQDLAEKEWRTAKKIRQEIFNEDPEDKISRQQLSDILATLGQHNTDTGQFEQALSDLEASRALRIALHLSQPDDQEYRNSLGNIHLHLGNLYREMKKWKQAEQNFQSARELYRDLMGYHPSITHYRQEYALAQSRIADVYSAIGEQELARNAIGESLRIYQELYREHPSTPSYALQLGGACCNWGHMLRKSQQYKEAEIYYIQGIELITPLYREQPQLINHRIYLRNCYWGRAQTREKLNRSAEAASDWAAAAELSVANMQVSFKRMEIVARARAGQTKVVERMVSEHIKQVRNPRVRYDLACIWALCAQHNPQSDYADRAMTELRQTILDGFVNLELFARDSDLDSLRNRQDFQALMLKLQANHAEQLKIRPRIVGD